MIDTFCRHSLRTSMSRTGPQRIMKNHENFDENHEDEGGGDEREEEEVEEEEDSAIFYNH